MFKKVEILIQWGIINKLKKSHYNEYDKYENK